MQRNGHALTWRARFALCVGPAVALGISAAFAGPEAHTRVPKPEGDDVGQRNHCADERSPDRQIASCSAVIARGGLPNSILAIAFSNRGVAYRAKGEFARAISDFSRALELEQTFYPARFNRAEAYLRGMDPGPAIADYTRLIDELDYAAAAWSRGVRARILDGSADLRPERETPVYHTNSAFHAYWNRAHLSRAAAYLSIGDLGSAARDMTRSAWGSRPNSAFYRTRAKMFLRQSNLQFAYASFEAALRADPKDKRAGGGRRATLSALKNKAIPNDDGMPGWPVIIRDGSNGAPRAAVALGALTAGSELQSVSAVLELPADREFAVLRVATFYFGAPRRYERARDSAGGELQATDGRTVVQLEEEESCHRPECPFMSSFTLPISVASLRTHAGQNRLITVFDEQHRPFRIVISAQAAVGLFAATGQPP